MERGLKPLLVRTHPWEPCRQSSHRYLECLSRAMLLMVAWGKVKRPGQRYAKCIPSHHLVCPSLQPLEAAILPTFL